METGKYVEFRTRTHVTDRKASNKYISGKSNAKVRKMITTVIIIMLI